MKNIYFIGLLFVSLSLFAQKEASNWYFGYNAGIHFNDDGSVNALAGGQMQTNEGCSAISDADGNLLFYTDGRTVWDRNHLIMPNADYFNGTGMYGDPSSTQSAIIVPKKNDPNIYYVFTVDEPHHVNASVYPAQYTGSYVEGNPGNEVLQSIPNADDGFNNGLNYSIVDLSVSGAQGNVGDVTTRNVPLYTYDPDIIEQAKYKCSEKVTAVKNSNGTGFWVVTQFIDKFYAFEVNAAGVNSTPVVSQLEPVVPVSGYRRNAVGCIKASPDGNYIAIAHQQMGTVTGGTDTNGVVYLYKFDKATGLLSNPQEIVQNVFAYGVEFSPKEKKLYVSYQESDNNDGKVMQYDLLSADIPASGIAVASRKSSTTMQLGPNGKIYKAINGGTTLDVINNPEEDGAACGYVSGAVRLPPDSFGVFGLPPFITSLFSASIITDQSCLGQATAFSLHVNNEYDAVSWNFGDGSPFSTDDEPRHTYTVAGNYTVVATITHEGETESVTREVTVTAPPVANAVPAYAACDADADITDGFTSFVLTNTRVAILGGQGPAGYTVSYYLTQEDADANRLSLNANAYVNTSNPQTIFARVINNSNPQCYATTSFELQVVRGPGITATEFSVCDDNRDGDDSNGRATFNLPAIAAQMLPQAGYTITWYATLQNAQGATGALSQNFYSGTTSVYASIHNAATPACDDIVEVRLVVNPLPPNVQDAVLVQCDTGTSPDGITAFDLSQAQALFTGGAATYAVTYYSNDANALSGTDRLDPAFINSIPFNQLITAKVENIATGCYRLLPLDLQVTVNTLPVINLELCDDSIEDGLTAFNLADAGFENGTDTVVYYATEADALAERHAITARYSNTNPGYQEVFARIESNNNCLGIGQINLRVWPLPNLAPDGSAVVCLNTRSYITLSAGISGSQYTYLWSTGASTPTISVNQPGVYTVLVTHTTHAQLCGKERSITVTASNVAQITDVVVDDLTDNNTVTIVAVPTGGVQATYLYSLDKPDGPWQESPYFDEVLQGVHTVYVYETNGCGVVSRSVGVLSIPNYFSPNGDAVNEFWYVPGLTGQNYAGSTISIYDRYGKLITVLLPRDKGWDGTFNGNPLPSTDYWYVIALSDGRTIKGHFSLLR